MNLNPKINPRYLAGLVVVAGVVVAGVYASKHVQAQSRASAEAQLEKSEITECNHRLAVLYQAWKAYRKDHKDQDPPSVVSMIPKYIKDPEILMCPTAARMEKSHVHLEQGVLTLPNNGGVFSETYGFKWMSAGYPRFLKQKGDTIPLIVCTAHREATYIAAYGRHPKSEEFNAANRSSLIGAVRDAPINAALRNGKIVALDSADN